MVKEEEEEQQQQVSIGVNRCQLVSIDANIKTREGHGQQYLPIHLGFLSTKRLVI